MEELREALTIQTDNLQAQVCIRLYDACASVCLYLCVCLCVHVALIGKEVCWAFKRGELHLLSMPKVYMPTVFMTKV